MPEVPADDLADVPPAGVKMARPQGDHAKVVKHDQWKQAVQGYPTLIDLAGLPRRAELEGESLVPLLKDPGAGSDRAVLCTHGYQNHAVVSERYHYIRYADGSEELYDRRSDKRQWTNLAASAEHDAVIADIARWLPDVS